ncbi:uncharacterized protein METZ01_LOCUS164829 [marine metagenome]|uniref:Uncharacterized protein n=1 Tax=marine metagenome TaxID=408172 RepID=A0A382BDS8_9ZZZZ
MNQQLINNKSSVQQFIMKSIVTGVTILMIYYLTIASFIARTVSFMDKVEPVLVQVEPVLVNVKPTIEKIGPVYIAEQLKILGHHLLKGGPSSQGFTYYYEKFADRMENISGENKNRLRESTRKILNNLSPIFDEQVDYYKTNILPRLDQ